MQEGPLPTGAALGPSGKLQGVPSYVARVWVTMVKVGRIR